MQKRKKKNSKTLPLTLQLDVQQASLSKEQLRSLPYCTLLTPVLGQKTNESKTVLGCPAIHIRLMDHADSGPWHWETTLRKQKPIILLDVSGMNSTNCSRIIEWLGSDRTSRIIRIIDPSTAVLDQIARGPILKHLQEWGTRNLSG